jgi:heme-degrading monooxygenase HmoA
MRLVTHVIRFIEMEENVTIADQLQKGGKDDRRSVIMINKFNVKTHDVYGLLEAWAADAAYLKQKQGFISAQLHRAISGSCVFVNYAVWESVEYFNQVTSDPAFRSALERYPESTAASSHLFRKVAVRGTCVD